MPGAAEPGSGPAPAADFRHSLSGALIGIGGLIGAGKSTLARELGQRLRLDVYPGPTIDDHLRGLLMDFPERHSFVAQVDLLNQRFKQHQEISRRGRGGLQDWTVFDDLAYTRILFGQGVLTQLEHDVYLDLYRSLSRAMTRPDLIVFLDVSPETAKQRIVARGRGRQVETPVEFLHGMRDIYQELLHEISRTIPVIRVPYDSFWDYDVLTHALCASYARGDLLDELCFPGPDRPAG